MWNGNATRSAKVPVMEINPPNQSRQKSRCRKVVSTSSLSCIDFHADHGWTSPVPDRSQSASTTLQIQIHSSRINLLLFRHFIQIGTSTGTPKVQGTVTTYITVR